MTEDQIVDLVSKAFPTFGGGRVDDDSNLIAVALKARDPQFALGVDVRDVVRLVLRLRER